MSSSPKNNNIYSVSSLNRSVADLLEQEFAWISVEGEISNLAQPASGHIYFSLKDASAQVSCAMFKGRKRSLTFQPENGNQVVVRAKVSLYQPRGNYQLIVDRMEEAGDGVLRRQFEALKIKLAAEGLFDETNKQEVPELPKCISIITSKTGAAIHDVLSVIERRFPSIPVKIFPVPVQGVEAAPAICNAIQLIDEAVTSGTLNCDVILLVRGGGSLEDLWSFNEETVARAIFDCSIPIISGVGHEVDVTIADFVADVRAATPTAAAETVTPDQSSWLQSFDWYQQRLQQLINDKVTHYQEKTQWLYRLLQQQHPQTQIQHSRQRSNELTKRLVRAMQAMLVSQQSNATALNTKLIAQNPKALLIQNKQTATYLHAKLQQATLNLVTNKKSQLSNVAKTLNAISPLQTLQRGYSISLNKKGEPITSVKQVKVNDTIETRLHNGSIISHVESCIENN
ncbi:Exodeoxyribonuclease VII large subunit [hydrothermal vent metagenome]|uniref:Exodeoxyribonuclease VII large subunit n=1 Tax=hydrothermal vent metagenome TaxID=652676 RepID=A0A3B0W6E6_9ZZZZ